MHIREATIADVDVIVTFNQAMALETEGKHLDLATLARGVRGIFERKERGQYFVAVDDDNTVIGQLMITREWSDWRNGDFYWIQSVYVHEKARRRGVYQALHKHVLSVAKREGAVGVRLYVEPHNARARATYEKLGMTKTYDVMEQS